MIDRDAIGKLSDAAKRHTRAVSAKDRNRRLAEAAISFVCLAASTIGEDPAAVHALESRLLAALAREAVG